MTDPAAAERRLHPLSIVGTSLKSLPGALAGMIGSFTVLTRLGTEVAMGVAALILLLMLGGALIGWWRFTYRIAEREIIIEHGLFSRTRRVIPFDRVRDIAIERPLIARIAGTARVRIETGGGKADEGSLDMVGLEEAHALRNLIRRSHLAEKPVAAAEEVEEPAEPVLFEMELGRVLIAGLLNFSLIFIALIFGALQYVDDLGMLDWEEWLDSGQAKEIAGGFGLNTALILAGLLLLLGVISGIVRTLAREYGFRLTASPAGLRRRRGLVTLSEVLIPARRTEAARIDKGWFSGLFGWESLAFQTLGADPKEGGVQAAAPLARRAEIETILTEAGFPLPPEEPLVRPPARALVRRCLPWVLIAIGVGAAAYVWPEALWGLPLPLLIAAAGFLHWRRDGHLAGERALYVRGGILRRRLWILPYEKLQTVSTASTPLQRALGLANVEPDLAGAPYFGAPDVEDLERPQAEALAKRLLERFYDTRNSLRSALPAAAEGR